jgi:hypothetical protein
MAGDETVSNKDASALSIYAIKPKTPNLIPLYHGKATRSSSNIPKTAKNEQYRVGNISSANIVEAVKM